MSNLSNRASASSSSSSATVNMVSVDSTKKYACETCIKGHRSSSCKHTDRPLYEIKRKGRPLTQCGHCRELRKGKQVHINCICMGKEDTSTATTKGSSIALPDTSGTDSGPTYNYACATGQLSIEDLCPCATPRKSAPRKPKIKPDLTPPNSISDPLTLSQVLSGPVHVPSSGVNHVRPHISESFSPYGRAYDIMHTAHQPPSLDVEPPSTSTQIEPPPSFDGSTYWPPPQAPSLSICGCGDSCGCAGCRKDDPNSPTPASGYTCSTPSACGGCLECYVQTLPPVAPPIEQDPLPQQFDIQPPVSSSCSHGCPPGLCRCGSESGCKSGCASSPEKACCKGSVDATSGFFDLPETLPLNSSASLSSTGSASGGMSSGYAGNYSFAGNSTELGLFSESTPQLSLYAPSNPVVDASYARSNTDTDGQVYNDMEMFSEASDFTDF